jgi:predicted dehydrogenase
LDLIHKNKGRLFLGEEKMKILIVGYGPTVTRHFSAWNQTKDCQVKAIVTKDTKKNVEILQRQLGVRVYSDLGKALGKEAGLSTVDICTPPGNRSKFVVSSMESGKNVLVEQPITLTAQEADEIDSVASEYKVKLVIGSIARFLPEYAKMKQMITDGAIGEPVIGRACQWRRNYL